MYNGIGGKIVLGKKSFLVDMKGIVDVPESCEKMLSNAGWLMVEKKVEEKKVEKKVEKKNKRFIRKVKE